MFLSPFSLIVALAMCAEGAKDATADGLDKMLGIPDDLDDHLKWEGALLDLLESVRKEHKGYALSTANALWSQKGLEFIERFVVNIQSNFGGKITEVDYGNPEAADLINAWCSENTKGLIDKVISADLIDSMTRLILTIVIYFKGKWRFQFDKSRTEENVWFNNNGVHSGTAQFMRMKDKFYYHDEASFTSIDIPYDSNDSDDDLSMIIMLPKHNGTSYEANLEWMEGNIAGCFDLISQRLIVEEVDIHLPKFKMETEYRLAQTLKDMGAELAFSDDADFSGITATENLKISEVVHKAFVKVDEEGTEAACVDAVVMKARCVSVPKEPKVFNANHPFLFFIVKEGNVLFAGKVNNPSE
jgi:serpin B